MKRLARRARKMIRALAPRDNGEYLDIAPGAGEPGLPIAALVPRRVVLTDLVGGMLAAASPNASALGLTNVGRRECDVDDLPFGGRRHPHWGAAGPTRISTGCCRSRQRHHHCGRSRHGRPPTSTPAAHALALFCFPEQRPAGKRSDNGRDSVHQTIRPGGRREPAPSRLDHAGDDHGGPPPWKCRIASGARTPGAVR